MDEVFEPEPQLATHDLPEDSSRDSHNSHCPDLRSIKVKGKKMKVTHRRIRYKENSDVFIFDSRTKAVMAKVSQEGIREKVQAVREVVPGRSNNEIVLVLKHYDDDVERAIQAFLEDDAKDVLQEWHHSGNKPAAKKKKNKKGKPKEDVSDGAEVKNGEATSISSNSINQNKQPIVTPNNNHILPSNGLMNGHVAGHEDLLSETSPMEVSRQGSKAAGAQMHRQPPRSTALSSQPTQNGLGHNTKSKQNKATELTLNIPANSTSTPVSTLIPSSTSSVVSPEMTESVSSTTSSLSGLSNGGPLQGHRKTEGQSGPANQAAANKAVDEKGQRSQHQHLQSHRPKQLDVAKGNRERTMSEASTSSDKVGRKAGPHAGLEKSMKDLQRQTVSLQRMQSVLSEGLDKSYKSITTMFDELRTCLNEREAEVMFEMDRVKHQATEQLTRRQHLATDLRQKVDRAQAMNDHDLAELRADIKHFVSERKIDEDTGSTTRFICEFGEIKQMIKNLGTVVPVKANYSTRRPSASSVASSDLLSPFSPSSSLTTPTIQAAMATMPLSSQTSTAKTPLGESSSQAPPSLPPSSGVKEPTGARVITQSESLTKYESSGLPSKPIVKRREQTKPSPSPNRMQKVRGPAQQNQQQHQQRGKVSAPQNQPVKATQDTGPEAKPTDAKKSRSARRRQKERERQREQKRQQNQEQAQHKGQGDTRSSGTERKPEADKQLQNQNKQQLSERSSSPAQNHSKEENQGQTKNSVQGQSQGRGHGQNPAYWKNQGGNRRTLSPRKAPSEGADNKKGGHSQESNKSQRPRSGSKGKGHPQRNEPHKDNNKENVEDSEQGPKPKSAQKSVTISVKGSLEKAPSPIRETVSVSKSLNESQPSQNKASVEANAEGLPQRKERSRRPRMGLGVKVDSQGHNKMVNGDVNANTECLNNSILEDGK